MKAEKASVDGQVVTAQEVGRRIDLAKGYKAEPQLNGHKPDTWIEVHFDWMGKPPKFVVGHAIIDEFGPSIMFLETTSTRLRILDSWHIGFKSVGRKQVRIVDIVGDSKTEYFVPLGRARY